MSDIVERLLDVTDRDRIDDAIQEITALRAEIERLKAALRDIATSKTRTAMALRHVALAALKEDGDA